MSLTRLPAAVPAGGCLSAGALPTAFLAVFLAVFFAAAFWTVALAAGALCAAAAAVFFAGVFRAADFFAAAVAGCFFAAVFFRAGVGVALGIDYNIFLMHRVREETARLGWSRGVLEGLTSTGGVITSAGVVLAATFAVFAGLPLVTLAQMGVLVGIGVLLDTFLVRTVLVPALALDLGRWFWWPGRLFREPPRTDGGAGGDRTVGAAGERVAGTSA